MSDFVTIFDRKINHVDHGDISNLVLEIADCPGSAVYFCNVHMLMLSQEDPELGSAMDNAHWVFADGVPVAWLQSRISGKKAAVIRGYEVMLAICERAAKTGDEIGLLGSTEEVLSDLANNLHDRFEDLNIAYQYSPPYMEDKLVSSQQDLQDINDSQVKWLFVGLGCPKQEKWIADYKSELNCPVLGVGAAFDWLSGSVKMPPRWMETSGLAWLYRLLNNPLRMWRRYTIYNTKFIFRVIRMFAGRG